MVELKPLEEHEIFATLKGEHDNQIVFGNWSTRVQTGTIKPTQTHRVYLNCSFTIQMQSFWYLCRTGAGTSASDLWNFISALEKTCQDISGVVKLSIPGFV